ncbi:MAG: MBL fold metallo-hydrolase [Clostridia bacterium]|nr:MBL fold metallo-hydrolase [Clostridia bacterium]
MLEAYTLFSGSSGNCIFVSDGDTSILIDAGKSQRAIQTALCSLGRGLDKISAIFLTHEHSDHTCGLEVISKTYGIPVHITYPSYSNLVKADTFLSKCAEVHDVIYQVECGNLTIKSFPIPHDSAQNVGYIISNGESTLGIATDMGYVTERIASELSTCHKVIIESNHDIEMVKKGPYPPYLKERILSKNGHLSNEICAKLCVYLAECGIDQITLAHLSRENNTPDLAFDTSKKALDEAGHNVILRVAGPNTIVKAID